MTDEDATPTLLCEGLPSGRRANSTSIPNGTRLCRYIVRAELGRGGMGVVVRAEDPKLERAVAIKIVRAGLAAAGRERLLREARAMARLSHPNVVPVYDVDVDEAHGAIIVMELVDGVNLKQYLSAHAPSPERIVALLVQAGRGLAAAHDRGLLHRDFKPSNVMVGRDGRARVTDFGLARLWCATVDPDGSSAPHVHADVTTGFGDSVTARGEVLGTPPYMAPEQLEGRALSAASDQYAFCVSLWESLTGERPFCGQGIAGLVAKRASPPEWPRAPVVRRAVVDAVRRGLQPDPAARWPNIDCLLAALSERPTRRRWLYSSLATASVAAVVAASPGPGTTQRCLDTDERLAGVWDDGGLAAALQPLGGSRVGTLAAGTASQLDAYAHRWGAQYDAACVVQDDGVFDRRMQCLRVLRSELRATVDLLLRADPDTLVHAQKLVEDLPAPRRCGDDEALASDVPSPEPEDAAAVREASSRLSRARALHRAARYDEALDSVDRLLADDVVTVFPPLRSEVLLARGSVLAALGQHEDAEQGLLEAARLALAMRQRAVALEATTALVHLVGVAQGRHREGEQHAGRAWALLREGGEDAEAEAALRNKTASLRGVQGEYEAAVREHRLALNSYVAARGANSATVASAHLALGAALTKVGRFTEAGAEQRTAWAIREATLGVAHPSTIIARNSLAGTLFSQGRFADAEAEWRWVREANERVFGANHPSVAGAMANIATALLSRGNYADAEAAGREALTRVQDSMGPQHAFAAGVRSTLGNALHNQGKHDEAAAEHGKALDARVATYGPTHPLVAASRNNLALVALGAGHYAQAVEQYRAALAILAETSGPGRPDVATVRLNLAYALKAAGDATAEAALRRAIDEALPIFGEEHEYVARGRRELASLLLQREEMLPEALQLAETAWSVYSGDDAPTDGRGRAAFVLARASWASGRDRKRARALAAAALETLQRAEGPVDELTREIEAWLRDH